MSAPDVTRYVFMCLVCPWSVQLGPRARSELGGAIEAYRAIAEVAQEHYATDHPSWRPSDSLRDDEVEPGEQLLPGEPVYKVSEAAGAVMAELLPRWWVERG